MLKRGASSNIQNFKLVYGNIRPDVYRNSSLHHNRSESYEGVTG